MLEFHSELTGVAAKKAPPTKKPRAVKNKPTVLENVIKEVESMDSMKLRREAKKDKLIGGQGTRKGKLMLYQRGDGTFYMELNGKKQDMDPKLAKTKSTAIKAATMFGKMLNAS
jgi:hypothetical protein